MINLRITHLRSYVAVTQTLHFGRAADELALGQSAVSQHVRMLEREIGIELLERTSRSVRLTAAGERFLPAARSLLRDLDRAVTEARAVGAGDLGTLRVAAQQAARTCIIPETLARLAHDTPGLTLDVIPTTTAEGLAALEQGTVDVALVRDPTPRESVVIERLATDPIMVALPADHPLAGDDTLALSQLRGEPRVGWARTGAPDYHDRITRLLRSEGVDPTPAYELRGVDTRLGAVASGLGWALESAAYQWLLHGRVRFVAIEGQPLTGEIVAAWPAVYRAPGLPAFLSAARAAAGAPTD